MKTMEHAFEPIKVPVDWINSEWAGNHLPIVRIACLMLGHNRKELGSAITKLVAADAEAELLENLESTRDHFEGMVEVLTVCLDRHRLTLADLGYTPSGTAAR
jgi:hypothetical protein